MFSKLLQRFKYKNSVSAAGGASVAVAPVRQNSLQEGSSGPLSTIETRRAFQYTGANRGAFYRYLRDRIPIVSAGVWTWVHLCATPQKRQIRGEEKQVQQAEWLLGALDKRIYPKIDGETNGMRRLTEAFFLELFTVGRFAARVVLLPDGSGVDYLEMLDPYAIRWQKVRGRAVPFLELENGDLEAIQPETFFHRTLVSELGSPDGIEPLASIPFVVEIEQRMLEDMARASHNAGIPRLQIRVNPPDPLHGEDADSYSERRNSYFADTVSQIRELGPDDNLFTWSDIEVEVVGGQGDTGASWKLNREQVVEDVITGLKLFPWALGRSHGTTKNWIYAQYNLLMQIVDTVQELGKDFAEWMMRLELRLAGNPSEVSWLFAPNQDPFVVDRNRARLMELERAERLVESGIITLDQAARELGYDKAAGLAEDK